MKTRLRIAGLLAVLVLRVVALRSATDWWASVVFTASLLVLSLAALNLVYRRGRRRAFWSAFVAFGVGYLVLAFGPWFETSIRPRLLTTKLIASAYPFLHPAGKPKPIPFQDIGHSLLALGLAGLGGLAARRFHATRDERRREAAEKAVGVILKVLEASL